MRSIDPTVRRSAWAIVLIVVWAGGVALAQDASAPPAAPAGGTATAPAAEPDAKLTDSWSNFLHYILIARPEAAESYGKAIIDANPDPRRIYTLSIRTDKGGATLARGRGMKGLAATVDRLAEMIIEGARGVRKDPVEIARWIKMLAGTPRQFLMSTERLVFAGEYAVPQLVAALEDPDTSEELRQRITTILPRLGKDAVRPLSEALQSKDPNVREVVARTLGRIGYRHAAPYLKQLAETQGLLDRTRTVAEGALAACAGRRSVGKPVAELFYSMGEDYYRRADSVMPDRRYDTANVWTWTEGLGLTHKVVPRAIFNEVYTMRATRMALAHDPTFHPAIPLWIAAHLRKEHNLAQANAARQASGLAAFSDPTHPADEPGAAFYALASSAKYQQEALARGLKDGDLAVCTGAIAALRDTCGPENLVRGLDALGGAQPLVAALSSPARLVRYMAAETLGLAGPKERFTGWHLVVPVLVEALRHTGTPTAVLADPDLDRRNKLKDLLRTAGCRVVDGEKFGEALQLARTAGGVDLAFVASDITAPSVKEAVAMLRGEASFSRLAVAVVARPADVIAARGLARADPLLWVLRDDKADAAGVTKLIGEMRGKAPGSAGFTPEQSADWAIRAANALKLLAETKTPVYDLSGATKSLIETLKDKRDPVRIAVAGALAQFRAAETQRAIADAAGDAEASEQARLACYSALSESVRLFGSQLNEEQIKAIIDVVTAKGNLKIRQGAAQALGALNLPAEKIKDLILSAQ